ncbi:MAG: hypothetical protein HOV68_24990 [Streptomycetaceae bacterium]|nr:hypothetical protein [Streptomycetaceae bacterium]
MSKRSGSGTPWVAVGGGEQEHHGAADQAAGGLVPGTGHHGAVREDFVVGQGAQDAVLVHELGGRQLGHQVVGGVLLAPGDVLGERLVAECRAASEIHLGPTGLRLHSQAGLLWHLAARCRLPRDLFVA